MVTLAQAEERKRKDLKQVADYAQAMMEKEFPSMGFPNEKWARHTSDGVIVFRAHWPCRSVVRIIGPFEGDTWEIVFVDNSTNLARLRAAGPAGLKEVLRHEKGHDLLSIRCIAIEWTKHLSTNTGDRNDN